METLAVLSIAFSGSVIVPQTGVMESKCALFVLSFLRGPVLQVGPAMFYGFCLEGVGGFGGPKTRNTKKNYKKNPSCAPAPLVMQQIDPSAISRSLSGPQGPKPRKNLKKGTS